MASKNAAHAAGIFSDMTVDGPEIGTLVVIVDRAKNLPNRKSIGKQDPYCAARLGKEAKKTETDKRGGQTPKWDQEMRFTVHDSPDYYQLKVSVFNDDKKTDLIGETWIDLKEVLMPGGGASDTWHNLNYRGKYAGEVRMEITYYDSRPKQEKAGKSREGTPANVEGGRSERDGASGPRVQKERVKRRPLPSDPITGIAPSLNETQPLRERVGPRDPRPKVTPAPAPQPQPLPVEPQQERPAQPQRGYPIGQPEYQQQERYAAPEPVQREQQQNYNPQEQMQRGYGQPPHLEKGYVQDQSPLQRMEYQSQEYDRGPTSRGDQGPYEQSPPQAQYGNKPSLNEARSNQSLNNQDSQYGQVPGLQESQVARNLYNQRYNQQPQAPYAESVSSSQQGEDPYTRGRSAQRYEYSSAGQPYIAPPPPDVITSPDGPPPPPPVHRYPVSANSSAPTTPGYGHTAPNPVKTQFERLRDGHRNSLPTYGSAPADPYQNTYTSPRQPYAPQPQQPQSQHAYTEPALPQQEQPRHKLLEGYDNHYSSMQPTVEDAPPTPAPFQQEIRMAGVPLAQQRHTNRDYDDVPSPAPLSFNRPGSSSSSMQQPAPQAASSYSNGYASDPYMNQPQSAPSSSEYAQPSYTRDNRSVSPAPPSTYEQPSYHRDNRSRSPAPPRNDYSQPSYNRSRSPAPLQPYAESHRSVSPAPPQRYEEEELARPGSSYMPPLPPTLVAGLDPAIAEEISSRIYSESRLQRQPRQPRPEARQETQESSWSQCQVEPSQYEDRPRSSQGAAAAVAAVGAGRFYATPSYVPQETQRQGRGIPSTYTPAAKRATSPMPPPASSYGDASRQHTISRKSVSPAPPPSRGSDGERRERRLSAVPFGPDDYSALNPGVPAAAAAIAVQDPDAKIVMHDGREIDPSDHLPSSSWAALPPNLKKSFDNASARETRLRGVTQPQTRTMQRRGRPQSEMYPPGREGMTPPANSRRLVKKTDRQRLGAQMQSSPLAPVSPNPDHYQRSRDDYRSEPDAGRFSAPSRAQTFDSGYMDREREVYGRDYRGNSGPPAPPKVPLNSGPPVPGYGLPVGGRDGMDPTDSAWALLEEMKSIDLGSGTRRRRGGHAIV